MWKKLSFLTILLLFMAGLVQAQAPIPSSATALESYAIPGYFLTARGASTTVRLYEGTDGTAEAQYNIVEGLIKTDLDTVSFASVGYPDSYLRHQSFRIRTSPLADDDLFKSDASFIPVPGLADPTNPRLISFQSQNYRDRYLMTNPFSGNISVYINPVGTDDEMARATWMFPDPTLPSNPRPGNKSDEISIDVGALTWKAGEGAETHNVFFGTDANNVQNATVTNAESLGVSVFSALPLDSNNVALSRLAYGTTYYWRVEEVSSSGTVEGDLWYFTTELIAYPLAPAHIIDATANDPAYFDEDAQEPNSTCNGLGLDANDAHSTDQQAMWLAYSEVPGEAYIQYEFDKVYKLYNMLVWNYNEEGGTFGAKDVNIAYSLDGATWTKLDGTKELKPAPGANGYLADPNNTVYFDGAPAKFVKITFWTSISEDVPAYGLSEVRFYTIPTRATDPSPNDNANNRSVTDTLLSWKAGRGVAQHYLYISTNFDDVNDRLVAPVIRDRYEPNDVPTLNLDAEYFWCVDEVNENEAFTTWDGPIWSYTTTSSVTIDNFDSGYDDTDANAVWATWIDGYGDDTNGAQMGFDTPGPYLSTTRYSGSRSAPLIYDDTSAAHSEVTAQSLNLPIASTNWSIGSPTSLVLWFLGDVNNPVTDQMYLKLNNTKFVYNGAPTDIARGAWTLWEIPLTGVDLSNIASITIGVEKTGATGSKGQILLDAIQLTLLSPAAVDPGTDSLVAEYNMENNLVDSVGGLNGTGNGNLTYQAGKDGQALVFDGDGATYVDVPVGNLLSTMQNCTITAWVNWSGVGNNWQRVFDFGTGTTNYVFMTVSNGSQMRAALLVDGHGEDGASASPRPAAGVWEHMAVVFDADNSILKLYLNGNLVGTDTTLRYAIKDMGVTDQNWLGKSQWSGDGPYNGMLDDFRIYNTALSDGEVKYISKN